MKKRRTYLIILLFLTSLLLVTTSYAWFTVSRVVTINTLNIHVKAEGGLEISSDATNWKAILDITDIMSARDNYPGSKNQIADYLEPVSTGGTIENGQLKLFYGIASNDNGGDFILTATRSNEEEGFGQNTTGKFIAFDMFLKAPSSKTIYLSTSAGVKYTGTSNTGIENAFRVAFLDEGTTDKDAPIASIQSLKGASRPYIWEPNYDVHTQAGVNNALNTYGVTTTQTAGNVLKYDGVISEIPASSNVGLNIANATNFPAYFKTVDVDYATRANFTNNVELFTLDPGITKIRIYMWIEGQDVDCENNASVGDVSIDLQLTTNPS